MMTIRILLADDHTVLRQGLAQVLNAQPDMEVVAQAENGDQAIALAREFQPDVLLLDIHMPGKDGLDVTWALAHENLSLGILILTMYRQDAFLFAAIQAGAQGYLLKETELEDLLVAIRAVARGEAVIDPGMAKRLFAELRGERATSAVAPLSEKDALILQYLAQGMTNREIAHQLNMAEKTVRNRLSMLCTRLHLRNRTEAALFAIKKGIAQSWE